MLTGREIPGTAERVRPTALEQDRFTEVLVLTQEGDDCSLLHRGTEIPFQEGHFRIEGGHESRRREQVKAETTR
jgi:hypothetical protein